MITIDDGAKSQIQAILDEEGLNDGGVRVRVIGRKANEFRHELSIVEPEDIGPEDQCIEVDGLKVYVDPYTKERINGASIAYVEDTAGGGFKVNNPNVPTWSDNDTGVAIQELIDAEINPQIASHGGFVELVDVKNNQVYVKMGGGCQGCGMADQTLKHGIERMIREAMPEIEQVIDVTDHGQGINPYMP